MNRAATIALTPLSVLYGLGVQLRNGLYRRGIRKTSDVGAPVISVGNLTTGGTGKTPLVELLASRMAAEGLRVCVLTRGYGRSSRGRIVVSDNSSVLADVHEAGDEPSLLAENLRGRAAVVCNKDRVAAARWAIENLGSQIFVLDDAFQHQRIQRAVNILTIDATNAFGNGKLLPAGILRESLSGMRRADCVVITRSNESSELTQIIARINEIAGPLPTFAANIKLAEVHSLDRKTSAENLKQRKVPFAAFCGLGNPNSFFTLLGHELSEPVYTRAFPDHHNYTHRDITQLVREASAHGAQALVTTAKDAVKLRSMPFDLPCYVIDIAIDIDDAPAFFKCVTEAVKGSKDKKSA